MNLDNDEFKILKNMNEISAKENMISTLRIRIEELTKKKEEYKNFRKKYIPYKFVLEIKYPSPYITNNKGPFCSNKSF